MRRIALLLVLSSLLSIPSIAQKKWHLDDAKKNVRYGTDVFKAYDLLKDKEPQQIIVAVLDNGTDINHKDLKPHIWTNTAEIPDNNIDDDGNGYVDDVQGWNFLGNIGYAAMQETRDYQDLDKKYAGVDSADVKHEDTTEFKEYRRLKARTLSEVALWKDVDSAVAKISIWYERYLAMKVLGAIATGFRAREELEFQQVFAQQNYLANSRNTDSFRKAVIGDDPDNPSERYYGSNNARGNDAHGTHCAGIVASVAQAGSKDWLRIMPVRVVPDYGDEYDKDVANGIRYAVDNGAKVISMSFGKYRSPHTAVVDSAILYALAHDVLLVHGAGNDGRKLDSAYSRNHPNPYIDSNTFVNNWIEVGANDKKVKHLIASFSNYGDQSVDLFAPGVDIYATYPDDEYRKESGTSMAAPVVAGIAAMIRSYYPSLSAEETKEYLVNSVLGCDEEIIRKTYRGKKAVKLQDMCISGGVINAANTVKALEAKKDL